MLKVVIFFNWIETRSSSVINLIGVKKVIFTGRLIYTSDIARKFHVVICNYACMATLLPFLVQSFQQPVSTFFLLHVMKTRAQFALRQIAVLHGRPIVTGHPVLRIETLVCCPWRIDLTWKSSTCYLCEGMSEEEEEEETWYPERTRIYNQPWESICPFQKCMSIIS